MRIRSILLTVLYTLCLWFAQGCKSSPPPSVAPAPVLAPPPMVIVLPLDPSLNQFAEAWRAEVSRRFPDAIVLLMHGGNFVGDEWICTASVYGKYTNVPDVIRYEQKQHPGKAIVVLACNPGHIQLHGFPNVYIALDSVWCIPDRATGGASANLMRKLDQPDFDPDDDESPSAGAAQGSRWASDPGVVGNVYELQEAR